MKYKLALVQTVPAWSDDTAEKENTFRNVRRLVLEAKKAGADVVALPEVWICPYTIHAMRLFTEEKGGRTYSFLSSLARETGLWIIGGTIPSRVEDKVYNACYVFNPEGEEVAEHRKNHLFRINIPGKQRFDEGLIFTKGEGPTVFETPWGKIGVAICFDIRFRDPIEEEALLGADLIVLPASFGTITGKAHWDLLNHEKAAGNQVYFAGINASRDPLAPYKAYGHSVVYDPWGDKVAEADETEGIVLAEIDTDYVREVRERLPLLEYKRADREIVK